MNLKKLLLFCLTSLLFPFISVGQNCAAAQSQIDLDVNNVTVGLLNGGDMWSNLSDGRYIVPKPLPGASPVSAMYTSSLWIGGVDDLGNLKLAAQTYRQGGDDFWPGPIINGSAPVCGYWDQHYVVYGSEITLVRLDFLADGTVDSVPDNLLRWPGRGNPYYSNYFPTALPNQDLAPFYDEDSDGIYDPYNGDFPVLGIDGCDSTYADQMVWWVINDIGNIHGQTGGDQLGVEIQTLAYSFIAPPLDYSTFYNYKIINKSPDVLNDLYIGQFADPDLGCWDNDYVGCDKLRSMGIVYNATATDPTCASTGYGTSIPLVGIDLLKGPDDDNGNELGMTSFIYYNNDGSPQGNPTNAAEFYGYLTGKWRDGSPIEHGGDGYNENTVPATHVYPGNPSDPNNWSECTVSNPPGDRRFIMSIGPLTLVPGAIKKMTSGVLYAADIQHPCPSFAPLLAISDSVQLMFDNCFGDGILLSNEHLQSDTEVGRLEVYPNPTGLSSMLTVDKVTLGSTLELWTLDGVLITEIKSNNETRVRINLDELPIKISAGIYFLTAKTEGEIEQVVKLSIVE